MVDDADEDVRRLVGELGRGGFAPDWRQVRTPAELDEALSSRAWDAVVAAHRLHWPSGQSPLDVVRETAGDVPYIVLVDAAPGAQVLDLVPPGANDIVFADHLARLPQAIRQEIRDARARAERRRSETALRQSEERYRRLFEGSGDAIFVVDRLSGRYLDANRAAEVLTGRTANDLRKLTTQDIAPLGAGERLKRVAGIGRVHDLGEVEYVRPDGSTRVAQLSVLPIDDAVFYGIAHDITDRKRAEDALHALVRGTTSVGEEFFRALVRELSVVTGAERVFVGTFDPDTTTRIRTVAAWADGAPRENFEYELDGSPCARVVGRELCYFPSGVASAFPRDEALATQGIESYLGMPLYWADRSPAGLLAVLHTRPLERPEQAASLIRIYAARVESELERLRAVAELRRREQQLQSIFSAAPIGVGVVVGRIIQSVNERMCDVTGYPADEQVGRETRFLYESDDEFTRVGQEVTRQIRQSGSGSTETRWIRKDGQRVSVLISWAPIVPAAPERGVTYAVLDITERQRAEVGLRRLAAAIEQSDEGVMITDPDGVIEYVNPAFERITGFAADEALGRMPRLLRSGKQPPVFYEQLWATIKAGRAWNGRFVNRRKDGVLYQEDCTIAPVFGADGAIAWFVATKRDVTKSLRLEDELRQSQRVESLGRLAAVVAHDFNNLLSPILGYAELLLEELHPSDERYGQIHEIEQASRRARDLTRQLLAFGRKQPLRIRPVDLNDVAAGLERLLRRGLREDVGLDITSWPDGPCMVLVDQGQVEQVVMNLAVNAQDAMPGGGQLAVRILQRSLSADECASRPGSRPGDYGVIVVTDTGCGMDADTRHRIFEPFYSTKGERGTGLGLSTVHGIVNQHGGHVTVDSEPGRGTTFEVYFPATTAATVSDKPAKPAPLREKATETILIVEDDVAVRALAETILRRDGYVVIPASGGHEAFALVDQFAGPIDLLLTDVILSGVDGRSIFQQLAERYPRLKVIFMSGYADDVVADRGVVEAGFPFLQKPFSIVSLSQKVREVLGG